MRELVERIVKQIVNNPDKVEVREVEGGRVTVVEVSTAKEDVGLVIGRKGKMANALRTIVGAVAAKLGKRAIVEILE
ncbi:MAG TPA: KH domain-containing protein [Candidatus Aerophobetes bacterium]|uniref:RNA-binding protein KhpA n=1 Tax=Aerophobetes bacterium TaxID=2030807 RepID=A0A7V5I009_UNCAE|nr:KH domain-containing protein [Candidatus Aerophobetes bacterium]